MAAPRLEQPVVVQSLEKAWIGVVLCLSVGAAIWVHVSGPLFRLGQTWEEDALFQIVARNISLRGPLADLFLDNYALGTDPAAQPFYYTHFPTVSGILQWTLGFVGGLATIKALCIGFFAAGQIYTYLFLRRIFPATVAIFAFTASALSFPGAINWADSTVHSLHWLALFGALYHFDVYLSRPATASRWHQLGLAILFFVLAVFLTLIHAFVVGFAALYLCWHRGLHGRLYGAMAFFATPIMCICFHFARVVYLVGLPAFRYDLLQNIRKSSDSVSFEQLADAYRQLGIVVWPTADFPGFTRLELLGEMVRLTSIAIGRIGTAVIGGAALIGLIAVAVKLVRSLAASFPFKLPWLAAFEPLPFLTGGLIAWAVIFPVHTANYFGATPKILVIFYFATAAGLLIDLAAKGLMSDLPRFAQAGSAAAMALLGLWLGTVWWQGYGDIKFVAVPGSAALANYRGRTFYTNAWPFLVSLNTTEWSIGGLSPEDAEARNYPAARYLMQRDYRNAAKYGRPDYYFWISDSRFAPFVEHQPTLPKFKLRESGEGWAIYAMCPCETSAQ